MKCIPLDNLREMFEYDHAVGTLRWRVNRRSVKAGEIAGCAHSEGYVVIRFDGELYFAHRLIYALCHGRITSEVIDHVNGCRNDNRIENLRLVSASTNQQNLRKSLSNNKIGLLGVTRTPQGRFKAQISAPGRPVHIGHYDSPEEAHAAYVAVKREVHMGCTI